MPLLPASLTEPLWVEFAALIGSTTDPSSTRPTRGDATAAGSPTGSVFDHVIAALVHGSGYERIATPGCSDRTIRRRLDDWADAGVGEQVLRPALAGYDQMIGLELDDLSVDGSITKSPCGGEVAGRSPVDRGKQGTKRSVACDGAGHPAAPGRGPGQRSRLAAAGAHPGRHRGHDRPAAPAPRRARRGPVPDRAPGPRLRLRQDPRPAGDPRASTARSRSRASRPRSRPADAGRSSAPTPG